MPCDTYSLTLLLLFLVRRGLKLSLELLRDPRTLDLDRLRVPSSSALPAAAAASPPAARPFSPRPPPPRDRDRDRDRDREPDLSRSRGPLIILFEARPPMTASIVCKGPFLPGSLSRRPSIPPAPMAAVSTRFPFSPVHPPGSLRLRKASPAPAISAALTACWIFLLASREPERERESE